MAGKSTLNRLELPPLEGPEPKYKKIVAEPTRMDALLVQVFLEARPKEPEEVILDVDARDDPLHGKQEGRFFHGYYKRYCHLYILSGDHLLCARLRSSNRGAADGVVQELNRIVRRLRVAWSQVRITIRGDSGFSNDELMAWCEEEGIDYVLGLAKKDRLKRRIEAETEVVRQVQQASGEPVRQFEELRYRTGKSWSGRNSGRWWRRWSACSMVLTRGSSGPRCRSRTATGARCTSRSTALGETWRTGSKSSSWVYLRIGCPRAGCRPANCDCIFPRSPM